MKRKKTTKKLNKYIFIISLLFFSSPVFSKNLNYENKDTGKIEVIVRALKDTFNSGTSSVKIEFYRTIKKTEQLGLMTVIIDGTKYLTELEGNFERQLQFGKKYDFEFIGTGYYSQKKSIKINKDCAYLIKVYMDFDPDQFIIIDKHVGHKE